MSDKIRSIETPTSYQSNFTMYFFIVVLVKTDSNNESASFVFVFDYFQLNGYLDVKFRTFFAAKRQTHFILNNHRLDSVSAKSLSNLRLKSNKGAEIILQFQVHFEN